MQAIGTIALILRSNSTSPNPRKAPLNREHANVVSAQNSSRKRNSIHAADAASSCTNVAQASAAKRQADRIIGLEFATGETRNISAQNRSFAHQILSRGSTQKVDVRPLAETVRRRGSREKGCRTSARTTASAPPSRAISAVQIEVLDRRSGVRGDARRSDDLERIDGHALRRRASDLGDKFAPLARSKPPGRLELRARKVVWSANDFMIYDANGPPIGASSTLNYFGNDPNEGEWWQCYCYTIDLDYDQQQRGDLCRKAIPPLQVTHAFRGSHSRADTGGSEAMMDYRQVRPVWNRSSGYPAP